MVLEDILCGSVAGGDVGGCAPAEVGGCTPKNKKRQSGQATEKTKRRKTPAEAGIQVQSARTEIMDSADMLEAVPLRK